MKLIKSNIESEKLGINIFSLNFLPEKSGELLDLMKENRVDVLKLHINAKSPKVFNILEELGLPFQVQYISTQTSMNISPELKMLKTKDKVSFKYVMYERVKHENILKKLVIDCMSSVLEGYYDDIIWSNFSTKELNLELQADYTLTFDNTINPDKIGFIGFTEDGEAIGFYLLDLNFPHAKAYMGGVLPKHRLNDVGNDGYIKIIRDYLLPNNFETLSLDVHIQNIANIKAGLLHGRGLIPSKSHLRLHLYPFFNYDERIIYKDVFLPLNDSIKIIQNKHLNYNVTLLKTIAINNGLDVNKTVVAYIVNDDKMKLIKIESLENNSLAVITYVKLYK